MKIAISATGPTLSAEIDLRFGRSQCFIIVDPETKEFEVLDNSSSQSTGGAGVATAQMISAKGVEAVITGNCGPKAYQVLSSAGIKVVTGAKGKVEDSVAEYKLGKYSAAQEPNVADHFGISPHYQYYHD